MITPAFVRTMAAYNTQMNRAVYEAAARLSDDARREDRGAFWRSIHGTLSHLVWADQMWMSRFDGWEKPGAVLKDSASLMPEFGPMQALRPEIDARLERWAAALGQDWLDSDQRWFSGAAQREVVRPRAVLVMHLFNHQTHHRGQAHAMITAAGERTGDTDLFLLVQ